MGKALSWLLSGRKSSASHLLLAPAAAWLLIFLVIPAAGLVALSFAKNGAYGEVVWSLGLQNYRRAFDPRYVPVLLRTLCFAGATTALCLLLGYPLAYFLSFRAGKWRNAMIIGLMVPFWTSCLVAFYSWMIILGKEGLLNTALLRFGFISSPIGILYTPFSVLLGLVYFYLPFTVLPLYGSLEKIPRSYVEAAYDLGANRWTAFLKVTLPLSLPGVIAGALLTFIPCLGDFLTAELLGGPRYYLLGNLISNQFLMAQDWPFGAALTTLLLIGLIFGLWAYRRWEPEA
ncbi:MAG TPA: ABC transporter permease [Elusimicrobiota bacterium]|jgi:spermidine/putrescine transport system permease protein|nr:ABC transporter permease [Elusimicrobiota bacterium]